MMDEKQNLQIDNRIVWRGEFYPVRILGHYWRIGVQPGPRGWHGSFFSLDFVLK